MAIIGLGGFGKSFLDSYSTMHGMDMDREKLGIARQQAAMEKAKQEALLAEQMRKIKEQEAIRQATGRLSIGLRDVPEHEMGSRLRGLVAQDPDQASALAAGKAYLEGTGGILPPTERFRSDSRNRFSSILTARREYPDRFTVQDVVEAAIKYNIPPNEVEMALPDEAERVAARKAFSEAAAKQSGTATGLLTTPGAPPTSGALPGQPGFVQPTQNRTGLILAGQQAAEAQARAGGEVTGRIDALTATHPLFGKGYGVLQAEQVGREAGARETDLQKQLMQADLALKKLDAQLKQAQAEMDPIKRAQIASQVIMELPLARQYINLTKDPAQKAMLEEIYNGALLLARRGAMPGRSPIPGAQGSVPPPVAPQATPVPGIQAPRPKVLNITPMQ